MIHYYFNMSQTVHINENGSYLITMDKFLNKEQSDDLFIKCKNLNLVTEPKVRMGICHRRVGFYSDISTGYRFAGQIAMANPLPDFLKENMGIVNQSLINFNVILNATLINHYRDGSDYIGSHSDDEKGLNNKLVAAISLFNPDTENGFRKFRIRRKNGSKFINDQVESNYMDIITSHGQLLVMAGDFQKHFKHEVPEEKSNSNPERISITYRSHYI